MGKVQQIAFLGAKVSQSLDNPVPDLNKNILIVSGAESAFLRYADVKIDIVAS